MALLTASAAAGAPARNTTSNTARRTARIRSQPRLIGLRSKPMLRNSPQGHPWRGASRCLIAGPGPACEGPASQNFPVADMTASRSIRAKSQICRRSQSAPRLVSTSADQTSRHASIKGKPAASSRPASLTRNLNNWPGLHAADKCHRRRSHPRTHRHANRAQSLSSPWEAPRSLPPAQDGLCS